MEKKYKSSILSIVKVLALSLTAFLFGILPMTVKADDTSGTRAVSIELIDYDELYILINSNGNAKVYYAQSSKNTWYEVEGEKAADGSIKLDISWISEKSDYSLKIKGSENTDEITVVLPAANTKLKVKFDQVNGILKFENEDGAANFEWKKSGSYEWSEAYSILQSDGMFYNAMEELRVKGGKIVVRLPQEAGKSPAEPGQRPSKQITISIPKRANAPKLKVDVNKLTLNTTTAMEYMIYSVDNVIGSTDAWETCYKKMLLEDIAQAVFAKEAVTGGSGDGGDTAAEVQGPKKGSNVVIAVRKASTNKAGHSKTAYISIEGQELAPTADVASADVIIDKQEKKFNISIPKASSSNSFQYAVVKNGNNTAFANLSWKNVSSSKAISFSNKSYPEGSTIYIRTKGVAETKKSDLRLPSACAVINIEYDAGTVEADDSTD